MQQATAYRGDLIEADRISRDENGFKEEKLWATRRRWVRLLLVSFISAVVTGVFGSVLSAASWLRLISAVNLLSIIGAFLLAIALLTLFLAAHSLDRIDDANREIRTTVHRKKLFERENDSNQN